MAFLFTVGRAGQAWARDDESFQGLSGIVSSAAFVLEDLALVIDGRVYIYGLKNKNWTSAQGVDSLVTEVSSLQCCFSKDASCTVPYSPPHHGSRTVFAGGAMDHHGAVEGVFNIPALSAILVLKTDNNGTASFSYELSDLNLSSAGFSLRDPSSSVTVVQPAGLSGHLVIWTPQSLLFSPNHGQVVLPVELRGDYEGGQFPGSDVIIQQVTTTSAVTPGLSLSLIGRVAGEYSEIAVLTSGSLLYYGTLGMDASVVKIKILTDFSEQAVLSFGLLGELLVSQPVDDPDVGGVDFSHELIIVQHELQLVTPPLGTCPVGMLHGSFDGQAYYIDTEDVLDFSAVFIPLPPSKAFPLVTVTDPHILAFQAVSKESGMTSEGNKRYTLVRKCSLDGGLSTLKVDVMGRGLSCTEIPPLRAYINVGCPPGKHIQVLKNVTACTKGKLTQSTLQNFYSYTISKNIYDPQGLFRQNSATEDLNVLYSFADYQCPLLVKYDSLWLPTFELWANGQFVELVPADFVLFEVHGMYNYGYLQSVSSTDCVSQPQTWRSMLDAQLQPDPSTAWTRRNYRSCNDPEGPTLTSPWVYYEVLRAGSENRIAFPNYNGIYIFKATVVDPMYSFCELSTTFSVYVYGAPPEERTTKGLALGIFLTVFMGLLLFRFVLQSAPKA
ncbi:cation channel sperm-associated auxiliary subunit delta-like [Amia ocellicauda]|uniref:cation channel sperm-associated auxiliary subunit delta-like n=1 Tax=Amia ocellicauda TaxID=2972642 RepID=UPI0034646CE2